MRDSFISASPFAKRMLSFSFECSNVASTESKTHQLTYQRCCSCCCRWGALLPDSLYCKLFSISPCSDRRWPCVLCKTLHPRDHDARSKGELHSTGMRRGGWPSFSFQCRTGIDRRETNEENVRWKRRLLNSISQHWPRGLSRIYTRYTPSNHFYWYIFIISFLKSELNHYLCNY